jgi:DNA/RNA-binding domain of Phe-tRNA-synthetase-like protein
VRKEIEIAITNEIFTIAPGYRRGIVVASNIINKSSSNELIDLIRNEEVRVRETVSLEDPRLVAWREAFHEAGIKQNKFRPSVDALARRVLNGGTLPSISTLVDIGTILSLRHILPCGAHSLNDVRQGLILKRASGSEKFSPFGSEEREIVTPGEVIYTDGNEVVTSKWAWRQANHTIIRLDTTAFELNIDALEVVDDDHLQIVIADAQELILKFLGVESVSYVLSQSSPSIKITVE